jgi:methionyl-tRNA formyltransferase
MGRGPFVRIVFFGTPEFAVPSLARIAESRHRVLAVVTQPDRPAGRGLRLTPGAVKQEALDRGIPVLQPERLDPESVGSVRRLAPDAVVVVAYGRILPVELLRLPRRGCVNLHASLLPRHRGAAPVVHAILAGDRRTGVTTLQMEETIDTGPILLQRETPLGGEETCGEVEHRLSRLGADLLVETLDRMETGSLRPVPQRDEQATNAPKIRPEAAEVPWDREAGHVLRVVRAFNPRPGASSRAGDRRVKIWRAAAGPEAPPPAPPGTILIREGTPHVACGGGTWIALLEIQFEGGRRIRGEEAVRGRLLGTGDRFVEGEAEGASSGPAPPGV